MRDINLKRLKPQWYTVEVMGNIHHIYSRPENIVDAIEDSIPKGCAYSYRDSTLEEIKEIIEVKKREAELEL